ncbi:MAG: hypothetical protein C0176_00800 [Mesoaciditoga sp.]|uniref:hypothetical protein n=1 Tax=Athalassotoga sp. TaxID=2022597 RepID=UPI000CB06AB5|nr:MAG: hypothetical protein C0185_01845 [Mesoaciditoga sp.]PMP80880.1 MAG: hypothetical protein C0176_00800 [Mesoaciditoga sp.]HEU23999.1 hypothetical protein [Mesoaciditoga lauensis]
MNEETPFIYKLIVVLVIVAAIFAAFMSILDFAFIRSNSVSISNMDSEIKSINGQINDINSNISILKQDIYPGGIIDKYISAYNFLSNTSVDLQRILTFASQQPQAQYFTIYVTGNRGVWINVSKKDQYILQAELRPGLSNYMFFYSGTPTVKTIYTISVDNSCFVTSNDASATYFLVSQNGVSKILKMQKNPQPVAELF